MLKYKAGQRGWLQSYMRTLLRRTSTGVFFQGPDQWTTDPAKARDFQSIDRALDFIEAWAMDDVELAFGFNGSDDVKAVPVEKLALRYSRG
jgi:hypothetical protein